MPDHGRGDLTHHEWIRLEPLLPGSGRPGGRWSDHRTVINGILYRLRTGVPWRDLPSQYGPWKTVYERTDAGQQTAPGTRSSAPFWPMPTPKAASNGAWSASISAATRHTAPA
jgi:transposase